MSRQELLQRMERLEAMLEIMEAEHRWEQDSRRERETFGARASQCGWDRDRCNPYMPDTRSPPLLTWDWDGGIRPLPPSRPVSESPPALTEPPRECNWRLDHDALPHDCVSDAGNASLSSYTWLGLTPPGESQVLSGTRDFEVCIEDSMNQEKQEEETDEKKQEEADEKKQEETDEKKQVEENDEKKQVDEVDEKKREEETDEKKREDEVDEKKREEPDEKKQDETDEKKDYEADENAVKDDTDEKEEKMSIGEIEQSLRDREEKMNMKDQQDCDLNKKEEKGNFERKEDTPEMKTKNKFAKDKQACLGCDCMLELKACKVHGFLSRIKFLHDKRVQTNKHETICVILSD